MCHPYVFLNGQVKIAPKKRWPGCPGLPVYAPYGRLGKVKRLLRTKTYRSFCSLGFELIERNATYTEISPSATGCNMET
jgi:hypothetical protein